MSVTMCSVPFVVAVDEGVPGLSDSEVTEASEVTEGVVTVVMLRKIAV